MEDYGYRSVITTALNAFESGSRGSGRTERMIAGLKPNTVIVVPTHVLSRSIRERVIAFYEGNPPLDVEIVVCAPDWYSLQERLAGLAPDTHVVYDSPWLLAYFKNELDRIPKLGERT